MIFITIKKMNIKVLVLFKKYLFYLYKLNYNCGSSICTLQRYLIMVFTQLNVRSSFAIELFLEYNIYIELNIQYSSHTWFFHATYRFYSARDLKIK